MPGVGVVIRCVGDASRAELLSRALRSVALQEGVRAESIVVFNGRAYDPKLLGWTRAQPNVRTLILDGPDKPRATLLGRLLVRTEFFCYLDDDDELLPGALARRVHTMRIRPWVDCVATNGFYARGDSERLLYENGSPVRENDFVGSLIESRNWLASCGGLFRTASVRESFFHDLPPHREWTVIAFRVAARLNVRFDDVPTFRVHDTAGSQSKTDSYVEVGARVLEQMIAAANGRREIRRLQRLLGRAHHAVCSHYRIRGDFERAWPAFGRAVRSPGGWKHVPYAMLLLARVSMPLDAPFVAVMRLLRRLVRNPRKYADPSWWLPILRVHWMRARAAALYTVPFLLRALVRKPLDIYVFPSRMDRFQPAETYIAWKVFAACGLRIQTADPSNARLAIAWHPATAYEIDAAHLAKLERRMRVLNAKCTDIRKTTVGRHFRDVFGYSLEVDPKTFIGPMVCKSEKNGAHDGRVVQGPVLDPLPGYLYQRFVSNPTPLGNAEYRVFIVGRKAVGAYLAYAPEDNRFCFGRVPEMVTLNQCFSAQELANIEAFCVRIGLDFGGLDVLRDASDGRIYISDCNNTVTGPSHKLPVRQQLEVVRALANAFKDEYLHEALAAQPPCVAETTG